MLVRSSPVRSAALKAQAGEVITFGYSYLKLAAITAFYFRTLQCRTVGTELDILTRISNRMAAETTAEHCTGDCTLLRVCEREIEGYNIVRQNLMHVKVRTDIIS